LQTTKASGKLGPLAALWKMKISYHIQAKKSFSMPTHNKPLPQIILKKKKTTQHTKQNKTIHKRRKPTSTLMSKWESVYLNTIPNQFCTTLQLAKL
jgi:hypothetical protein